MVVFSDSGMVNRAKQIQMYSGTDGTGSFDNSLLKFGAYQVFGGKTMGFNTKYNDLDFDSGKKDVFLMKYLFDKDTPYNCLLEAELTMGSTIRNKFVKQD